MSYKKRTITIDYWSHVSDELWADALREIDGAICSIACDYAIAMPDDNYVVYVEDVTRND